MVRKGKSIIYKSGRRKGCALHKTSIMVLNRLQMKVKEMKLLNSTECSFFLCMLRDISVSCYPILKILVFFVFIMLNVIVGSRGFVGV